ncbi:MAG: hypothetical protein P9M14_09800 [Candidatus Alcyoniella australis]|nr:hypothetical protein [Candidatus Alcyoniella australis]
MHTNGNEVRSRRSLMGWAFYLAYRFIGELTHLLLFSFMWLLGGVEYLSASWVRWIFGPGTVLGVIIYRAIKRRDGPVMLYGNAAMVFYNCTIWIGGFLYVGQLAALWLPTSILLTFVLLPGRWVGRLRAAAWALILIAIVGTVLLELNRSSEKAWVRDCANENRRAADDRVQLLDPTMHPYDIDVDPSGRYLFVAYGVVGRDGMIVRHDLYTGERREQRTVRGVQRIDFSRDGSKLLTTPWGRLGHTRWRHCPAGDQCLEQEGVYLLPVHEEVDELDCCKRPVGKYFAPIFNANNTFAAVQEPGGDLLAITEINRNVIRMDAQGREKARIAVTGMNLYDLELALDGRVLVVSDQQAPWVHLVDVSDGGLSYLGRVWVSPFGFGLLADPLYPGVVYCAGSLFGDIFAVDVTAQRRLWRMRLGYGPRDLGLDRERRILLVGNYFDGTVSLVDLETRSEIARPFFGRILRGVCYSPHDDRVYAATACGVRWAQMEDLLEGSAAPGP